jgi:serine phosphatase RsbU (regulator of sigma subunit)
MMALAQLTIDGLVAPASSQQASGLSAYEQTQTFGTPAKSWRYESAESLAELDTVRREHVKLQQAIFEAAQVQRRLCAPRELTWGSYEFAGEIFPVRHLSGDFFKVMELGSALGLVLGDIAGKGLSAGIWQAHLMGLIQRAAHKHASPAAAMAEVNSQLCSDEGQPPLTALFFARIDARGNEIAYCNAGLPAPLLVRANKNMESLDEGGPMLGALSTATFHTGRVVLDSGDMLVAYSDGVTECRNAEDQEFETHRLATAAKAVHGASANQALFSLLGTVLDFAASCSPADDLTVLVLRRNARQSTNPVRAQARVPVPGGVKEFPVPQRRPTSAPSTKNAGLGGRGPK